VFEAIRNRRSVRAFTSEGVSEEEVKRLIDAARWAPSAGNIQPWGFIIVRDAKIKRGLVIAALDQTFIEEAPVVIVVCADERQSSMGYGSRGLLYTVYKTQPQPSKTCCLLPTLWDLELAGSEPSTRKRPDRHLKSHWV